MENTEQKHLIEKVNEECNKIVQPILEESKRSLSVENLLTNTPVYDKYFQVERGILEVMKCYNAFKEDMLKIKISPNLFASNLKLDKNLIEGGVYPEKNTIFGRPDGYYSGHHTIPFSDGERGIFVGIVDYSKWEEYKRECEERNKGLFKKLFYEERPTLEEFNKRNREFFERIFGSLECATLSNSYDRVRTLFISPKIESEKIKKILNCFLNPQVISLAPEKKDRIYDYFRARTCPSVTDFLREDKEKISWENK